MTSTIDASTLLVFSVKREEGMVIIERMAGDWILLYEIRIGGHAIKCGQS